MRLAIGSVITLCGLLTTMFLMICARIGETGGFLLFILKGIHKLRRQKPVEYIPLNAPRTMEEARTILKGACRDDWYRNKRVENGLAFATTALTSGIACFGIGLLTDDIRFGLSMWAVYLGMLVLLYTVNLCLKNRGTERVESGETLFGNSDEALIEAARAYAEQYNAFQEELGRKPWPGAMQEIGEENDDGGRPEKSGVAAAWNGDPRVVPWPIQGKRSFLQAAMDWMNWKALIAVIALALLYLLCALNK